MWGALISSLAELSQRERILLAVLAGVGVPVACVFLLVLPLMHSQQRAQDRLADATRLYEWVQVQASQWGSVAPVDPASQAAQPVMGVSDIEQRLIAAGLRKDVTELSRSDTGSIRLRFDDVSFLAAMRWIDEASQSWGYSLAEFELERRDAPDRVALSLTLGSNP